MSRVFIIAEAGVNHNGDLDMAYRLVDAAKDAGADAVKFQTFKAERLVKKNAPKAEYQKNTTGVQESQLDMIKRLELNETQHRLIQQYCTECGIEFLSTAFDTDSTEFLNKLGMKRWKVPSGEITNLPYLRRIASFGKPILVSTGMAKLGEVEAALDVLEASGVPRSLVTVLHCTTEYPAPLEEVNLKAMVVMGQTFGVAVGYSDHTLGITIPIAAVALGATVIEKHFTLDRNLEGPDHKASLEPRDLAAMVIGIRELETALGDGVKRITRSEARNRPIARKSIVAAVPIKHGAMIREEDLTVKRPGTGISPMEWDRVVGSRASIDYDTDEELRW